MPDWELSIIPLEELLDLPEMRQGSPQLRERWGILRAERIAEDQSLRRIPRDQSIHALLPEDSQASTSLVFPSIRRLWLRNIKTIDDLRGTSRGDLELAWTGNSRLWGNTSHKLTLSLWSKVQEMKGPEP